MYEGCWLKRFLEKLRVIWRKEVGVYEQFAFGGHEGEDILTGVPGKVDHTCIIIPKSWLAPQLFRRLIKIT